MYTKWVNIIRQIIEMYCEHRQLTPYVIAKTGTEMSQLCKLNKAI